LTMKRILKKVLGVVFIVLGLLALVTPFSPGSWLALIGFEILGLRILLERKLLSFLPVRYRKKVENRLERVKRMIPGRFSQANREDQEHTDSDRRTTHHT